ncbi:hypothetical protein LINPERHAP1_LOCUS38335 [Linum perenne]
MIICPAVKAFQTKQDTDYLIRFLRGLNAEYDVVKTQLLMMKPLPSVTAAYDDALQHEEKLKGGIAIGQEQNPPVVFAVSKVPSGTDTASAQAVSSNRFSNDTGEKKICRYCKKENHLIDECRRLKWKREQEQKRRGFVTPPATSRFAATVMVDGQDSSSTSSDTSITSSTSLSPEELHQLRSLLQTSTPSVHRAFSVSQGAPAPPTYSGPYQQQDDWFGH